MYVKAHSVAEWTKTRLKHAWHHCTRQLPWSLPPEWQTHQTLARASSHHEADLIFNSFGGIKRGNTSVCWSRRRGQMNLSFNLEDSLVTSSASTHKYTLTCGEIKCLATFPRPQTTEWRLCYMSRCQFWSLLLFHNVSLAVSQLSPFGLFCHSLLVRMMASFKTVTSVHTL